MSTVRSMIDSKAIRPLVLCILPLCLTLVAVGAAASHADHGLHLASGGIIIGSPEIYIPKTPPDQPGTSTEQGA